MKELNIRAWNEAEEKMYYGIEDIRPRHLVTYMLSSGMLDKNNREIYVGDVVKSLDGFRTILVEYDPNAEPWSFLCYWESPDEYVVIGNIFEHPDLLENI